MRFKLTDFTLAIHTLDDVRSMGVPRALARIFCETLQLDGVLVQAEWRERESDRWLPTGVVSDADLSRLSSVSFVDSSMDFASLSIDSREHANPAAQNVIVLRLTKKFLARQGHVNSVLKWITAVTELVSTSFGLGYESDISRFDFRLHPDLGLQSGVPGIFLVTVFGRPFVEIIGREKLLATPGTATEALPGGAIVLLSTPALLGYDYAAFCVARRAARDWIGEEFFDARPEFEPGVGGVVSVSGMIRALFRGDGNKRKWKAAQVRPVFRN